MTAWTNQTPSNATAAKNRNKTIPDTSPANARTIRAVDTDMALRIRKDGRVLCAAMHAAEPGDTYLDDGIHYQLSAERKLLVTEPMEKHKDRGEWWWCGNVPPEVTVDDYYRPNADISRPASK